MKATTDPPDDAGEEEYDGGLPFPSTFPAPGCYSIEKETMLYHRRTTDAWVLPFGAFILLWLLYTSCQTLSVGDGRRLSHGYDYQGRLCSVDVSGRPYVYWPSFPNRPNDIDFLSPVCVPKCPSQKGADRGDVIAYPNRTASIEILPDGSEVTRVEVHPIDVPVYASRPFGGQYCFPLDTQLTAELIQRFGLTDEWMVSIRIFKSLQTGWPFLLGCGLVAATCSFGYLILVPRITWLVCWLSTALAPLGMTGASLYLILTALTVPGSGDHVVAPVRYTLLTVGIGGAILGLYLFLSDSESKRNARHAVALSKASCECMQAIPSLFAFPIGGALAVVFIWTAAIVVLAGLLTSPASIPKPTLIPASQPTAALAAGWPRAVQEGSKAWTGSTFGILSQFRFNYDIYWRCWLVGFGCIWFIEFIHAMTQFCVSFAVALWYFTVPDLRGHRYDVSLSVPGTLWVALRHHLGTLQLSAACLSIARCLQFLAWSLRSQFKRRSLVNRYGSSWVFTGLLTGLKSLEDSSRYINNGGIVECALQATDFFPSCRTAYGILHEGIPTAGFLGRINSVVSLINSLGLASTVSGVVLWASTRFPVFNDPLSSWFIDSPAGLSVAAFALVAAITHVVVFSFDQLSATLLYCYSSEVHRRGGSPVFAPDALRALVEETEAEQRLSALGRGVRGQSLLSLAAQDPLFLEQALHPTPKHGEEQHAVMPEKPSHVLLPGPSSSSSTPPR